MVLWMRVVDDIAPGVVGNLVADAAKPVDPTRGVWKHLRADTEVLHLLGLGLLVVNAHAWRPIDRAFHTNAGRRLVSSLAILGGGRVAEQRESGWDVHRPDVDK